MKKLLALSEPTSSKARPKSSPPPIHRNKIGGLVGASKALAVDLTAESSSVTSLPAARKGNHNSGKPFTTASSLMVFQGVEVSFDIHSICSYKNDAKSY